MNSEVSGRKKRSKSFNRSRILLVTHEWMYYNVTRYGLLCHNFLWPDFSSKCLFFAILFHRLLAFKLAAEKLSCSKSFHVFCLPFRNQCFNWIIYAYHLDLFLLCFVMIHILYYTTYHNLYTYIKIYVPIIHICKKDVQEWIYLNYILVI